MTISTRTAKEQFDRQASHYDADWNTWSQATLDWLLLNADAESDDVVLDVATGSGFTALAFAPKVRKVVGTDVSTGMLTESRRYAVQRGIENVDFVEAAAENLPFDDESFDIITCRIAAHHFTAIDSFASEAYRCLRPGGRLVIADTSVPDDDFLASIWQNQTERLRDTSHARNYNKREWRLILERPGFTIVSISDAEGGIRIPLNSWIEKAGCTPEQEAVVRQRFAEAPQNVREQFKIEDNDGETVFTWLRVLIKAEKTV